MLDRKSVIPIAYGMFSAQLIIVTSTTRDFSLEITSTCKPN